MKQRPNLKRRPGNRTNQQTHAIKKNIIYWKWFKQNQTKKGKTQGLFFEKILSTSLRTEKQCKKNPGSASKNKTKSLRNKKKHSKAEKVSRKHSGKNEK